MLNVQQFLGVHSQTLVTGSLSDGEVLIETVIEGVGYAGSRRFKVPAEKVEVSYVAGPGQVTHRITGGTLDELRAMLKSMGVVFK